jgi:hypothetical protein
VNAKALVGETCVCLGLGEITLGGELPGGRTFLSAYIDPPFDSIPYKIELLDQDEIPLAWESGLATYDPITNTLTRDSVNLSTNNNLPVDFGAGSKRVFVYTIGDVFGLSPSNWVAGSGMFTDASLTTQCKDAGDVCAKWVADDGAILTAVNSPRCEWINGILTPCLEPINGAYFITDDDYQSDDWEGHMVVGQSESFFGPHLCTVGQQSGFIGYGSELSVRNPSVFSDAQKTGRTAYSNATMLGISVAPSAQRLYIEGGIASNLTVGGIDFFAPISATSKIQIGRFLTGGFRSSMAIRAISLSKKTLTDAQRTGVLSAHSAYADSEKPKLLCVHDSMMALTILGGIKIRGAVNLELTRSYQVSPAGQSGFVFADSSAVADVITAALVIQGNTQIPCVVFVTNDLRYQNGSGTAGASYGASVVAWVASKKADGVIGAAFWVRPPSQSSDANFDAECAAAHAVIYPSVDGVLDLSQTVTTANGRLASDQIHLTPAGAKFVAQGIEALVSRSAAGPAGPAGATGPTGPQGATGASGASGAQGPIGPASAAIQGAVLNLGAYLTNKFVQLIAAVGVTPASDVRAWLKAGAETDANCPDWSSELLVRAVPKTEQIEFTVYALGPMSGPLNLRYQIGI